MATVLITRPRLANLLLNAGVQVKQTVNPWNNRCAWEVEATENVVLACRDFYAGIGKPLPKAIENAAAELEQKGGYI